MKKVFLSFLFLIPILGKAQIITTIQSTPTPTGLARDHAGNLYYSDGESSISKRSASGVVSVLAGGAIAGYSGDGGPATAAQFNRPLGVAVDTAGNVYIADSYNNVVRKIDVAGTITTFAGLSSGTYGYSGDGGPANLAMLSYPMAVATDRMGNVYIADGNNNVVRKVDASGTISTFAGVYYLSTAIDYPYSGDGGPATAAYMFTPSGVFVDVNNNVYIADGNHNYVHKVDPTGIITSFAGNGYVSPAGSGGYAGDGGLATAGEIWFPILGIAADQSGNVYFSDSYNNVIRKVDVANIITTFEGTGAVSYTGDNGPANFAQSNLPTGMVLDSAGNMYFCDTWNNAIRKISGISGLNHICLGDAVSLQTTAIGGAWYTSNSSIVTVSATGNATSVAAGTANVLYVVGSDTASVSILVNATPFVGPIIGLDTLCHNSFTLLTDSISGGHWTKANHLLTIHGGLISPGTEHGGLDTVYYSVPYTCGIATVAHEVYILDNNVEDIIGPDAICVGDTAIYYESTVGGVWSLGITGYATQIAPGVVVGLLPGYTTISYTTGEMAGCGITKSHSLTIKTPEECGITTSVPGISVTGNSISIFPNPAHDKLMMTGTGNIGQVSISNLLGQTLFTGDYPQHEADVDIAGLAAGVYFIKVGNATVSKFVKE